MPNDAWPPLGVLDVKPYLNLYPVHMFTSVIGALHRKKLSNVFLHSII